MLREEQMKEDNNNIYESLKTMYYSGKVKPSFNKIKAELKSDPENQELSLLACKCLERMKDFDTLLIYANAVIKLAPKNGQGYYYKGVALQHVKGKEQEALKNFNEAIKLDPENTLFLKSKASTHLLLFKDFDLPISFADKHRIKAEESLLKVMALVEPNENAHYQEFLTLAEVKMMLDKTLEAKMFYLKAVNSYEKADESEQDKNIYKDIIKGQKASIRLLEKFTE